MSEIKTTGHPNDPVIIWSGEHGAYWRSGEGYTIDPKDAAVFSWGEAGAALWRLGPEKQIQFHVAPKIEAPPKA